MELESNRLIREVTAHPIRSICIIIIGITDMRHLKELKVCLEPHESISRIGAAHKAASDVLLK
jgi:hypothetical protein